MSRYNQTDLFSHLLFHDRWREVCTIFILFKNVERIANDHEQKLDDQ